MGRISYGHLVVRWRGKGGHWVARGENGAAWGERKEKKGERGGAAKGAVPARQPWPVGGDTAC